MKKRIEMEPINKIKVLIGLDLSEMDKALLRSIQIVRQLYPISNFIFLHNVKLSELPDEFQEKEKINEITEGIKSKLTKIIQAEDIPEPYNVEVTSDDFSEIAFLNVHQRIGAKLVILGNKQQLEGNGGLPQKLMRMLPSAVLLVPETFNFAPKKILAAVDFSKYTDVIYRVGKHIIQESNYENLAVDPVYVVKVPWQFFPGLSENEIKTRLKEDADEKQKKWSKQYADFPKLNFVLAKEKSIATNLLSYANKVQTDILIMGVKGTSALTNLFLGSVANEMIQKETNFCILLVKRPVVPS